VKEDHLVILSGASGSPSETPHEDGEIVLEERPKTKEPRRFVVIFHNDDYTTQEFVVHVLMSVFHRDSTEATRIMLQVHHKGWGVAGTYSREVAETKVDQVQNYAKERGHPLRVTCEPEGYGDDE
jgi:ATP-dependent Clp protease adaptor protein ClpS